MLNESSRQVLEKYRMALGSIEYKGVPVFALMRLPIIGTLRRILNFRMSSVDYFIRVVRALFLIGVNLSRLIRPVGTRPDLNCLRSYNIIFVMDHNRKDCVQIVSAVAEKFQGEKICIITKDKMIYKDLKRGRITPFYVDGILGNPGKRPYFSSYRVFLKAIFRSNTDLLATLNIFKNFQKSMQYIDAYMELFFDSNTKAVITLCDAHNHEYAISSAAKNNKIKPLPFSMVLLVRSMGRWFLIKFLHGANLQMTHYWVWGFLRKRLICQEVFGWKNLTKV
jgi:hypothetical protein